MISFTGTSILQRLDGLEKNWTPAELFETYDPMAGEPLAARNEAMKQILYVAEEQYDELSKAALQHYSFWKLLLPGRIESCQYEYAVQISDTYHWELTVNSEGLFYKDLNAMYSPEKGKVHEQLFSDFWFYGPRMPIPDLYIRKQVVAQIRNAFLQVSPLAYQHFELFEYPKLILDQHWAEGDATMHYFVNLRLFGIEYGKTTRYDGLVYIGFISFEHFLADPQVAAHHISPEIRVEITTYLAKDQVAAQIEQNTGDTQAEMKRIFMENGGMRHDIFRDYGDEYKPAPLDEIAWKKELIDKYKQRLNTVDDLSVLRYIATVLRYHQVPHLEELLVETAKTAPARTREAIALLLDEFFDQNNQ